MNSRPSVHALFSVSEGRIQSGKVYHLGEYWAILDILGGHF